MIIHGRDSSGNVIPLLVDATGRPIVTTSAPIPVSGTVTADTELPAAAALADGSANPTAPAVGAANLNYNGATFERQRSNLEAVVFNGSFSTTQISPLQVNYNARGIYVWFNVTAATGGTSINLGLSAVDGGFNLATSLLASGALTTTGFRSYMLYPGATATAALTAAPISLPLPRYFFFNVVFVGGGSYTFQLRYQLIA